jgi:hypothetical protein
MIFLFLFSLVAFAQEPTWVSPDFSVVEAPAGWRPAASPASLHLVTEDRAQCEARLREALCVNDETMETLARKWNRVKCDPDSASYLPVAMEIYDEMPERVRPLYCSLEKVFLSDNLWSIAFASAIKKGDRMIGAFVGARKSSFTGDVTASALLTWKEQLIYGGSQDFLHNDPASVQLNYGMRLEHMKSDGLFYAMMHELGHLVDFQNNANRKWEPISWTTFSAARRDSEYQGQRKVCYYNCGSRLRLEQAYPLYLSMRESAFITAYSGVNAYEDFAEFWTWNILRQFKQSDYRIEVPGQPVIDMNPVFENPKVQNKMKFIRAIWDSPDTKFGF